MYIDKKALTTIANKSKEKKKAKARQKYINNNTEIIHNSSD